MMKRPQRKKVKGMTLVEIVISLFIFTVMAGLLVTAGVTATKLNRNAVHITRKTSIEAPIAEAKFNGNTMVSVKNNNMKTTVNFGTTGSVDLASQSYSTANAVNGNAFAQTEGDYNLSYVNIDLMKCLGGAAGDNLYTPTP